MEVQLLRDALGESPAWDYGTFMLRYPSVKDFAAEVVRDAEALLRNNVKPSEPEERWTELAAAYLIVLGQWRRHEKTAIDNRVRERNPA